jgi:integrase
LGEAYVDNCLVFVWPKGKQLCDRTLNGSHMKPILKRAGVPQEFGFYDLRHACDTLLLAANVNPKIVAERLGHASVTLTRDKYSHVLPTM